MKKVYHLGTCSTCVRIIKDCDLASDFELQDIKTNSMTEKQVDKMAQMAGSYETIFSRRAMKFRQWGLHEKKLTEKDYKALILQEYTFLKRPVIILDNKIFVGSAKKTIENFQTTREDK